MKRTWVVVVLVLLVAVLGAVQLVRNQKERQAETAQRERALAQTEWAVAHIAGAMNCMAFWDWRDGLGSQAEDVVAGHDVEKVLAEVPQLRSLRDALVAIEGYRREGRDSDDLIVTAASECDDAGVSHEKAVTFRNAPALPETNADSDVSAPGPSSIAQRQMRMVR